MREVKKLPNSQLVSYILRRYQSHTRYEIDRYLLERGYHPGEIEEAWETVTTGRVSSLVSTVIQTRHAHKAGFLFLAANGAALVAIFSLFLPCYDWNGGLYNGFGFPLSNGNLPPQINRISLLAFGETPGIIWLFLALLFSFALNWHSFYTVQKGRYLDSFRLVVLNIWALGFVARGYVESFATANGEFTFLSIPGHLTYGATLLTLSLLATFFLTFFAIHRGTSR